MTFRIEIILVPFFDSSFTLLVILECLSAGRLIPIILLKYSGSVLPDNKINDPLACTLSLSSSLSGRCLSPQVSHTAGLLLAGPRPTSPYECYDEDSIIILGTNKSKKQTCPIVSGSSYEQLRHRFQPADVGICSEIILQI